MNNKPRNQKRDQRSSGDVDKQFEEKVLLIKRVSKKTAGGKA